MGRVVKDSVVKDRDFDLLWGSDLDVPSGQAGSLLQGSATTVTLEAGGEG